MSAVSKTFTPASRASRTIPSDSSYVVSPHAPNIIVPRQNELTVMPVRPRGRYSISHPPSRAMSRPDGDESAERAKTASLADSVQHWRPNGFDRPKAGANKFDRAERSE